MLTCFFVFGWGGSRPTQTLFDLLDFLNYSE
jgi:hypothetical protein